MGQYLKDRKGFKKYNILDGEKDLTTPYLHLNSFNRDTLIYGGCDRWKPFLCFDYIITTHEFHSTNYRKPLSKNRIYLHKEIMKLHNKGWGYTKIHHHLIKNEFEIGKSRTTVDLIIRKIKKREEFLSQPVLDCIGNFRIKILKIN